MCVTVLSIRHIIQVNPKALFVHCYAHSLNLAVQDTTKENPVIRDALDVTNEITKVVKGSPKREAWLEQIKSTAAGKIQRFSYTR